MAGKARFTRVLVYGLSESHRHPMGVMRVMDVMHSLRELGETRKISGSGPLVLPGVAPRNEDQMGLDCEMDRSGQAGPY